MFVPPLRLTCWRRACSGSWAAVGSAPCPLSPPPLHCSPPEKGWKISWHYPFNSEKIQSITDIFLEFWFLKKLIEIPVYKNLKITHELQRKTVWNCLEMCCVWLYWYRIYVNKGIRYAHSYYAYSTLLPSWGIITNHTKKFKYSLLKVPKWIESNEKALHIIWIGTDYRLI
jgi:hypothetical protein